MQSLILFIYLLGTIFIGLLLNLLSTQCRPTTMTATLSVDSPYEGVAYHTDNSPSRSIAAMRDEYTTTPCGLRRGDFIFIHISGALLKLLITPGDHELCCKHRWNRFSSLDLSEGKKKIKINK